MNALYMPLVSPGDSEGVWSGRIRTNRSHTLKPRSSNSNQSKNNDSHGRRLSRNSPPVHEGVYPNESFSTVNTLDLNQLITKDKVKFSSTLLMNRNNNFPIDVEEYEAAREQHLQSIRNFGYEYLRPPGVSKTMQALLEENEDYSDAGTEDEEMQEDVEGEFEVVDEDEEQEDTLHSLNNPRQAAAVAGTPTRQQAQPPSNEEREDEEQEIDLDAEIPEADDEDEYDEEEYQEGFMAEEEEYEVQQQQQQVVEDDYDEEEEEESPSDNENSLGDGQANSSATRSDTIRRVVAANKYKSLESKRLLRLADDGEFEEGVGDNYALNELVFDYSKKEEDEGEEEEEDCDEGSESDETDMSFE